MSDWEQAVRQLREQEQKQRKEADDAVIKTIHEKLRKVQRETKHDMTVIKVKMCIRDRVKPVHKSNVCVARFPVFFLDVTLDDVEKISIVGVICLRGHILWLYSNDQMIVLK